MWKKNIVQSLQALKGSRCSLHQTVLIRYIPSVSNSTTARVRSKIESNRVLLDLSRSGRVCEARQLFDEMPERDEYTWNTMVATYARSGRVDEATNVFIKTPFKTSIAWSNIISVYCKHGFENEALALFWQMQLEGKVPSEYTLGSLLGLCSSAGSVRRGEQIHGYATKSKLDANSFVATGLVDMYAKCLCIAEAERIFGMVAWQENNATWTAMLTGYAHNEEGAEALRCFQSMRARGIESNQFALPSILSACGFDSSLEFGSQVHGLAVKTGFAADIFVQSALIDMYAKCGDLSCAKIIMKTTEVDDAFSWNSMIAGCTKHGMEEEALCWLHEMRAHDMPVDEYTYPSVLNSLASAKFIRISDSIHCLAIKTGHGDSKLVNNALINTCAKQGRLDEARIVFCWMKDRDVISWSSLITGHTHGGSYEDAVRCFREMLKSEPHLDEIVLAGVLRACAELTAAELGQQVHAAAIKHDLASCTAVGNALIAMYSKAGSVLESSLIFDSMENRDVASWTSLIIGYAQNGKGKDSVDLYDQMIGSGVEPDMVAFIGVLFACAHAGLVEEGRHHFESMSKVYGIKPGLRHHACMIDLLARSGRLVEARGMMEQMSVEPDVAVWKSLLAASRAHMEVEEGERAAKKLFQLAPTDSMPYILLSNLYSSDGRWEDAARIRREMKSRGINKEPGCSWIQASGRVHIFVSEDRSHGMMREIYLKVEEIIWSIKKAGYVPDMNSAHHNMDEEGRELGLAYHSEKLAVAFGLLVAARGAPIRVFKNLRVCGDCHSAMEYISALYHKHIILRDSNCFHHFREGSCSCGGCW